MRRMRRRGPHSNGVNNGNGNSMDIDMAPAADTYHVNPVNPPMRGGGGGGGSQQGMRKGPSSTPYDRPRVGGAAVGAVGPVVAPQDVVFPALIRLTNLHFNVIKEDLEELFSKYGVVLFAKVDFDRSGRSTGNAVVKMEDSRMAHEAVTTLNGVILDGIPLQMTVHEIKIQTRMQAAAAAYHPTPQLHQAQQQQQHQQQQYQQQPQYQQQQRGPAPTHQHQQQQRGGQGPQGQGRLGPGQGQGQGQGQRQQQQPQQQSVMSRLGTRVIDRVGGRVGDGAKGVSGVMAKRLGPAKGEIFNRLGPAK
ncbi:hypothetical protein HDU76_009412 [Blyttiomyces sp. JEL0837]|nr:hypothetical protein HDU76_009412 [Blyttiomyces sp. JEL0837]